MQCELTSQELERWPNVWICAILSARYHYTPHPVTLLFLTNLFGYRGPTIVKPAPSVELSPWVRALGWLWKGTILSGGGAHSCPASIKSWVLCVMSGEADWTAGSTHLHHALGTSEAWVHTLPHALLRGVDSNHPITPLPYQWLTGTQPSRTEIGPKLLNINVPLYNTISQHSTFLVHNGFMSYE